jgi:hypothetical protein
MHLSSGRLSTQSFPVTIIICCDLFRTEGRRRASVDVSYEGDEHESQALEG